MGTVFQDVPPRPHAIGALTHTHTQDTHRNSTLLLLLLPPAAASRRRDRQTGRQRAERVGSTATCVRGISVNARKLTYDTRAFKLHDQTLVYLSAVTAAGAERRDIEMPAERPLRPPK